MSSYRKIVARSVALTRGQMIWSRLRPPEQPAPMVPMVQANFVFISIKICLLEYKCLEGKKRLLHSNTDCLPNNYSCKYLIIGDTSLFECISNLINNLSISLKIGKNIAMATTEKPVMVVGIDESEHSFYALEWTLDHFFTPCASNPTFKLLIVHAKPSPSSAIGLAGIGTADVSPIVEEDLKKTAARVVEKAKDICISKLVNDVTLEVADGDASNVICEAVETHHASILVVGYHGYGAIKRTVLGSVSDYCTHNAQCSVMVVKRPKIKH